MYAGVADTHAALWHLFADPRLSLNAGAFIEEATRAGNHIAVSAVSMVEILYLVEKGRLDPSAYTDLKNALANPKHVLREVPLTTQVVEHMRTIPRDLVPDMPDRIVAGTALYLAVPVISCDHRIWSARLPAIW